MTERPSLGSPTHRVPAWRVATQYPVHEIGRAAGLPTGQVHCTAADARGRLWMATPNGLVCSDGSRVVSYGPRDGLSTHGLRAVAVGLDGSVWVGSDVGVDRVHPDGRIEAMFGAWRWGLADDIAVAVDGTIWVAAAEGLVRWAGADGWIPDLDPRLASSPVQRVTIDRADGIWVASRHLGVITRTALGWQPPVGDEWLAVGTVLCVQGFDDGRVAIGGTNGAVQIDASGRFLGRIGPVGTAVFSAHASRHELWLGTADGVLRYTAHGEGWKLSARLLESMRINHITSDRRGNIWLATDSGGVANVEPVRRAMVRPDLQNGAVFAVRPDGDGGYLVAGDRGCGVYEAVVPGVSDTWRPIAALISHKVWDVVDDGCGALWAATESGLLRITADGSEHVGADHPVLAAPGRVLLARNDALWVGTLSGLVEIAADGSTRTVVDEHGASLGYVYTLVEDGDTVWIGTLGNGLWRSGPAGVGRVRGDGLGDTGNSYAIAVREHGFVAAVQDDRIVIVDRGGPPRLLAICDEALAGWAAAFDHTGSLWVGGSTGLCEYDTLTGELSRRVTLWMGTEGWEFTTSRALVIDDEGRVLCGLNSGLAIVDPARLTEFEADQPTVELATLTWSNVTPQAGSDDHWVVPQGRWTVEASIYSTWPYREATRLFRHRLLGFEPTWSQPTGSATIQFSSLPPGDYELEAQAHSQLTGWGPSTRIASIEVRRDRSIGNVFRRSIAARSLRRLARENHALEQRVRERTTELTTARDQLAHANRELVRLSTTDALTGVANRRQFDLAIAEAIESTRRTENPLSLLLIDVDDFKSYNDACGHIAGDDCLRAAARSMCAIVRDGIDLVARYGGEEFAVLLPDTDAGTAMIVADRLRNCVIEIGVAHPWSSVSDVVTISVGVATTTPAQATTAARLIGSADRGLYEAKHAGRNRCRSGGPTVE